jgi:FtsP/CotA-like multicopper oxidase with cupredoxin domain
MRMTDHICGIAPILRRLGSTARLALQRSALNSDVHTCVEMRRPGLDLTGVHKDQLWGDINVVNGVPWPVLDITSTWHRFRVLNASPSRPWILQVCMAACTCVVAAGLWSSVTACKSP